MSSIFDHVDCQVAVITVVGTGDKLTFRAPIDCLVTRWGVISSNLGITGSMALTGDVLPKSAGTRVTGATASGFDTAGGAMTVGVLTAGKIAYHEPKFDPSGVVAKGAGVQAMGNMLLLTPGDSFIITASVAGATDTAAEFFIEYRVGQFQAAQAINATKL